MQSERGRGATGQEGRRQGVHGGEQQKLGQNVGDGAGRANAGPPDHLARSLLENHLQSLETRQDTTAGKATVNLQNAVGLSPARLFVSKRLGCGAF